MAEAGEEGGGGVGARAPWAPWRLGVIGAAVGVLDVAVFAALGVEMRLGDASVLGWVGGYLIVSFGALGWMLGEARRGRAQSRARGAVIAGQLAALEAQQRALREARTLATIGSMAAGVAHEVRNPLAVMRASAMLLLEDLDAASEGAVAARFIGEECDRLNAFVGALLDLARPLEPRLGVVEATALLEAAARRAQPALARAGAEVAVEANEEVWVAVDADLVTSVLLEAIHNAVEALAGAREPGEKRVALRAAVDGAAWARLEVADSGPGVGAAAAARVFEPFFTTRAEGTGLGLAMAARVVEGHGGGLGFVEGAGAGPGGAGACLRLRLPAAPEGRGAMDAVSKEGVARRGGAEWGEAQATRRDG